MIQAFDVYKTFLAVKQHFTTDSYDYFKYHGKVNVKPSTFDKKKDKYFYYKLGVKYNKEIHSFFVAAFATGITNVWIGDLLDSVWDDVYTNWLKRNQALSRTFKMDVRVIADELEQSNQSFKTFLVSDDGNLPPLIKMHERGLISIETCVIINRLTSFAERVESIHPSWDDRKRLLKKYSQFVRINNVKDYAHVLRDGITV